MPIHDTGKELLMEMSKNTMVEHLGIEFLDTGLDFITARMPVDHRTCQPLQMLHGGASVVLAETLGSVGSYLLLDPERFYCVGIEVNANHIRPVRSGWVYAKASIIHKGNKIHVWDIRINNDQGDLVCISRLTTAILEKNREK